MQEDLEAREDAIVARYGTHWVGGYPSFVQQDVRYDDPVLERLNRVLLHLGQDSNVEVGDAGTLNVMIAEDDLRNRRFDRAYLAWDCF